MRQGYYASTSYMDDLVGELLAALTKYNFSDNTIIALCGDHGNTCINVRECIIVVAVKTKYH